MMYSYNPTNQRYLQEKIKELEKELELAVAEKEFLNTKVLGMLVRSTNSRRTSTPSSWTRNGSKARSSF